VIFFQREVEFPSIAMFVRSVLLGGAAALGASAMLVIPEMEPKVDMIWKETKVEAKCKSEARRCFPP
jgi:hypothetical protein